MGEIVNTEIVNTTPLIVDNQNENYENQLTNTPISKSPWSINETVSDVLSSSSPYPGTSILPRFTNLITVEPMLFLQMIAWSSTGVTVQNLYIETICRREYHNVTSIDCSNLSANQTAETHVEEIAAVFSTYKSLIEAGLPVIFSLFLGPWSDKHGSKPAMMLPLFGYILSTVLLYIFAMVKDLNPAVILIASVPVALTGGVIAFILSGFRYAAAITTTKNRSFRMAVAEGSWFLGSPIGLLGSAALLKTGGYQLVFLVCIILYAGSLFYTIFLIKNDKPETTGESSLHFFKDMFNVEAVKNTFLTTFRKRPGSQRLWILLLLGIFYLRVFTLYGSMTLTYLYTRNKFHWDVSTYSAYTTYDGVIGLVGSSLVAVLAMKVFKVPDAQIGLLSAISYLGGAIVWLLSSFTTLSWMMYLGATVQMLCGLITIMSRSMLSKVVSKDEVGKVYSFLASGEAAIPLFSAPLYNLLYAETVQSFPGLFYLVNASLNVVIMLSFICFCVSSWKETILPHEELEEETDDFHNVNRA